MADGKTHIFATRRGRAFRNAILLRDLWACRMCGCLLVEGRKDHRAAVVDHIEPVELRPDLALGEANARAVCRRCHALCDSIEKRLSPDSAAIRRAKLGFVGLDGYPAAPPEGHGG